MDSKDKIKDIVKEKYAEIAKASGAATSAPVHAAAQANQQEISTQHSTRTTQKTAMLKKPTSRAWLRDTYRHG